MYYIGNDKFGRREHFHNVFGKDKLHEINHDKVKKSIHAHNTLIETLYEQLKKTHSKMFFLQKNCQRFYRKFH